VRNLLTRFSGFSGSVFIVSVVFLLLGVTEGIPGNLVVDEGCRKLSILVGLALALMSLLLRYHRNDDKNINLK
jgi:hypothetical protein